MPRGAREPIYRFSASFYVIAASLSGGCNTQKHKNNNHNRPASSALASPDSLLLARWSICSFGRRASSAGMSSDDIINDDDGGGRGGRGNSKAQD